ncbi:hypothetical protein [Natrialba aegyptia]|nr:hypothetical protein [Natrialba aegyptia]
MTDDQSIRTRRNVLRTTGIVSLGTVGLTGAVSAHNDQKKKDGKKRDSKKKHGKKRDEKKHGKKYDEKKHGKKHDEKKHGKKHDEKKHGKRHGKKKGKRKKGDKKGHHHNEKDRRNGIVVETGNVRVAIGPHGISVRTSNNSVNL